jgi:two-component system, NtrC family, sensor kinase
MFCPSMNPQASTDPISLQETQTLLDANLRLVIEQSPGAIAIFDLNLCCLLASQRWQQDHGLLGAAIVGRSYVELLPQFGDRWQTIHQQCLIDAIDLEGEDPYQRLDGKTGWLRWQMRPWRNQSGAVSGFIHISEDITVTKHLEAERKQAELQLQQQKDRYRSLVIATSQFVWIADPNGFVVDGQIHSHIGHVGTAEADQGWGWLDLLHPDDRDRTAQAWICSVETKSPYNSEYRLQMPNGHYRHYAARGVPILETDGSVREWIGVYIDIHDRRVLEQQLALQQARFNAFFSAANAGLAILDDQLRYVHINKVLAEVDGLPIADHLGRTISEVLPDLGSTVEPVIQQVFDTGQPLLNVEVSGETLSQPGVMRHWLNSYFALPGEDGKPIGVGAVIIEITDRKQVEQALQESQRRLSTLMNSLPGMAYRCRNEQTWTEEFVSSGCLELTGYSAESLIDNYLISYEQVIHPEDREMVWEQVQAALQLKQPFQLVYRIITASGEEKWVWEQGVGIFSPEGEVAALEGFVTDITERRLAEVQLQSKAQREQLLNRLASQIRSSLDLNQILETAVQSIRDLLQVDRCIFVRYQPDQDVPYWEVIQESNQPGLSSLIGSRVPSSKIAPITQKALGKEIILIDDIQMVANPTIRRYFESRGYLALLMLPVHTQSGTIGMVNCCQISGARFWHDDEVELLQAVADNLAIAIDQAELYKQSRTAAMTAQIQTQQLEAALQELQQTQAQMLQSEKMSSLGQLVAGVAHEINNPVNFISGNLGFANNYTHDLLKLLKLYQQSYPVPLPPLQAAADAIDIDFLVEDLPKLLASMRVGAERIKSIVASLRSFSRMDEAEMKAVNIHEGIDSTLMILQSRLKVKTGQPDIQIVKAYGDLPLVECYVGQLNQVFMNLLTNAIDAIESRIDEDAATGRAEHPGTIRIQTALIDTDKIQIRIADNGAGIAAQVEQRLFDPFFTTKPVGQGTGLGLSISYQIVTQKHGGQIYYNSTLGQGTEFVVTIPLNQKTLEK